MKLSTYLSANHQPEGGQLYAEVLMFPSPAAEARLEEDLALELLNADLVGRPATLKHGMNLHRMSAYATIQFI